MRDFRKMTLPASCAASQFPKCPFDRNRRLLTNGDAGGTGGEPA
jgi:hypothetical protein